MLQSCGATLQQLRNLEAEKRVRWYSADSQPGSPHPNSPPPAIFENTSGDSSPCDDEQQKKTFITKKLSVNQVCKLTVNTSKFYVQIVDAKKTEKNEKQFQFTQLKKQIRISPEWINQRELIILNCDPDLETTKSKHNMKRYFKDKFKVYPFVVFEYFEQVYFQGVFSYIFKVNDDIPTKFIYFNLMSMTDKHKKFLGENIQVAQYRKHPDDPDLKNVVQIIIRFMPCTFTKEKLQSLVANELKQCKVEEFFQYESSKYGIIYVQNLELAEILQERLIKYFLHKQHSQTDIQIANKLNGKLSEKNKKNYQSFLVKSQTNSELKLKQILKNRYSIDSPDSLKKPNFLPEQLKPLAINPEKTDETTKKIHRSISPSSSRSLYKRARHHHTIQNGDKKHNDRRNSQERRKTKKKERSRSRDKKHSSKIHHEDREKSRKYRKNYDY